MLLGVLERARINQRGFVFFWEGRLEGGYPFCLCFGCWAGKGRLSEGVILKDAPQRFD